MSWRSPGRAGEHGHAVHAALPVRDQLPEVRSHLGRERVLLGDRQLAAVPRLAGPAQGRCDHVGQRLFERQHGERLVEGRRERERVAVPDRRDQRIAELAGLVERRRAGLVDHARGLADAPAVANPVAQPFDALDVRLAVASLPSRRPDGPEHAVALFPLAERVGCDAGPAGEGGDVEERRGHWTIPGHRRLRESLHGPPVPEALWTVRVSPWLRVGAASDEELLAALQWARDAMRASIAGTRPGRSVYRRAGRPCRRCGTPVESRGQGGDNRTAYWCPGCQGLR